MTYETESGLPSIREAAAAHRHRERDPVELVQQCLDRIEQQDDCIKAWVLVDREGALRRAEQLRQAAVPAEAGFLWGIPVAIKDIVDVAGWPTKAGSPLRESHLASLDAPLVQRLRDQGAVILGKTVTTEFACFDPSITVNPRNIEHTPGGSSSGSAAAIASGMALGAIGSQTGGSITRPASYCGVAGLKPTWGKVSLAGVVPVSRHLDHAGPLARRVDDLALIYATIADQPEIARLTKETQPRLRLVREFFLERADQQVQAATLRACEQAGIDTDQHCLSFATSMEDVLAMHRRVMAYEAAEVHRADYTKSASSYGPKISTLIEEGLRLERAQYDAALKHQQSFRAEVNTTLSDVIAVMPSTVTPAPHGLESTGDPSFNSPWSYAGNPTVTIPCGMSSAELPCGLQLVAAQDAEAELLQAAGWCESRIGDSYRS